jgi:hypothetical protein
MASFLDQIPQFTPYIEQLPVDMMVKVGMQKQAQYEQGVQKIQSAIDNVAGLKVLRPVDKNYLQSKLNQLGGNLTGLAAGDFSNFQLVNSVAGMTNQISQDEFIRSAVSSTANDSKQLSQMETDDKKGILTPHARYWYQRQRDEYLNNPNLTTQEGTPIVFNGNYSRSWDIDKNVIEAVNKVGDSKFTAEKVFKTDSSGQIMYDKNGPVLSEYAVKEIKEGKFSENISAAIETVLSRPEAQQELLMRGVYKYRGYDDINDFVKEYEREKNEGVALLESKKLDLLTKATLETDPDKKLIFQQAISKTDDDIKTLKNYEDARIKQVVSSRDLDGYKGILESQSLKNKYLKAYVTETYSRTYEKSAPWEAYRQKINDERDWWKSQQTVSQGWANIKLKEEENRQKKEEWKYDPKNPNAPINQAVPYEKGAALGDLYKGWVESGNLAQDELSGAKRKLVVDYMIATNHANGSTLSDDEITRQLLKYEKDSPGFFERKYSDIKSVLKKNPENPVFSNLITSLPALNSLEKKVENYVRELDDMNNDPEVIRVIGGKFKDLEKNLKPVTFTSQGKSYTLSAKDQINYVLTLSSPIKSVKDKAWEQFKNSVGISSELFGGIIGGLFETPTISDKLFGIYTNEQREAKRNMGRLSQSLKNTALDAKEEFLKRKMKGNSPLMYNLYPDNADNKTKESVNDRLKTLLSGRVPTDDVLAYTDFYSGTETAKSKYNVVFNVDRGGVSGDKQNITLDLYDGESLVKSIPVNKNDMTYVLGKTVNVPSVVSDVVRKVQWNENKQSTNSITSDPNNPNAYQGAHYSSDDFYYLNKPNIMGADIKINNMGQPNIYFYVKDANGDVKGVPFKTSPNDILPTPFTSIDAADVFIKGITKPAQIDNILRNAKIKL